MTAARCRPSGKRADPLFMDELMNKKVVDLLAYRIEKTLKENGFSVKRDDTKNVKILIKLNSDVTAE
jgi:hypothetical protein